MKKWMELGPLDEDDEGQGRPYAKQATCPKCKLNLVDTKIIPRLVGQDSGTLPSLTKFKTEFADDKQYEGWFDICFLPDMTLKSFMETKVSCPDHECEDEFRPFGSLLKWIYHVHHDAHVIEHLETPYQSFGKFVDMIRGKFIP